MQQLRFMDFCAGIGGGRIGLCNNGLNCVAHSEIDPIPNQTYQLFFTKDEKNFGDLMQIDPQELPDFDVLIGGFPCQTFSIVGKRQGFNDHRGQVIYGILNILKEKNVPYFILENVKGLVSHDKGQTLKNILQAFDDLDYIVDYKVVDSIDYGVPQMRERIYMIGIHKEHYKRAFVWPEKKPLPMLADYLIDTDNAILDAQDVTLQKYLNNKYNQGQHKIEDILQQEGVILDWRQSDLRLYKDRCPTLRTGRHGILYVKNQKLHKLSGFEALLLQGFPRELADKAKQHALTNTRLLSQAGNAMTVNVVEALGQSLLAAIA